MKSAGQEPLAKCIFITPEPTIHHGDPTLGLPRIDAASDAGPEPVCPAQNCKESIAGPAESLVTEAFPAGSCRSAAALSLAAYHASSGLAKETL